MTTNKTIQEPPAGADETKSDMPAAMPGPVSRRKSAAARKKTTGPAGDTEPVKQTPPGAAEPVAAEQTEMAPEAEKKGRKKDPDEKRGRKKKEKEKKRKKNKSALVIRFNDEHIPLVDARAEALGLSRAAWVRMVVAQALAGT